MRIDSHSGVQWSRILNKQEDLKRKSRDYFRLVIGRRKPVYGAQTMIIGYSEELVDMAKRILFEQSYLPTKVLLMRFAGVRLGVPTWEIKADNISTVGWKAYGDRHPTNEAQRRMRLAHKRARRCM
jgi:hypothetical protein